MKKSLLAVAAIGAFASAAQAQSSVTVYGILDVGYAGSNTTQTSTSTSSIYTAATPATTSSTYSGLGQSGETTSRLGFKGTEDLGGGKSAFFTAEFGLYPQEQDLSGTNQGGLRNRQTFVGLKQNGLGDFAIGTQYTPIHNAVAMTDPGGQNNQTGSVIYTGQGDGYNVQGAAGGNTAAYQSRYSNALTLNTEKMAGFQGHLMAVLNNTNSTVLATNTNGTTTGGGRVNSTGFVVGLDYAIQNAFITANYSQMKQVTDLTNCAPSTVDANGKTNGATSAIGSCGFGIWGQSSAVGLPSVAAAAGVPKSEFSNSGNALNVVDTTQYYGATYDFGILKAYASYINRKAAAASNSNDYQQRTAQQVGVRSFITPTIEAWASAGMGRMAPYGSAQPSANFNAWQLGSNYYLSKRTNLYGIYGQFAQSVANYSATLGGTANQTYSNNSNSYAVGVRHTF
jgi:predicted porin